MVVCIRNYPNQGLLPPGSGYEKGAYSPPGQHCTGCWVSDEQQPRAETAARALPLNALSSGSC